MILPPPEDQAIALCMLLPNVFSGPPAIIRGVAAWMGLANCELHACPAHFFWQPAKTYRVGIVFALDCSPWNCVPELKRSRFMT
jgi:hypothetical protein